MKNKLQELDIVIGEALEHANDAARLVRLCSESEIDTDENLIRIGHSINNLWEVREKIYEVKPDLKADFVDEFEKNEIRFEELSQIHNEAYKFENSANNAKARDLYSELLEKATFGHFKRLAEAGLYRTREND